MHFHSDLAIDIENNMIVYVSFAGGGGRTIRSAMTPAIYNRFMPVETKRLKAPDDFADRAANYVGDYRFWRGNFSSIEKAMGITSSVPVVLTPENTLIIVLGPFGGEYAEIDHNLFQLVDGYEKVAFQENEAGEIIGFVFDGLTFMSTYKASFYSSANFNFTLLGLSLLIMIGVVLRRIYQWAAFKALASNEKKVANAAFYASVANYFSVCFWVPL